MSELKKDYNKPGHLNNLVTEINKATNIPITDIIGKLPRYIKSLSKDEQEIISKHYFQTKSINEISKELNLENDVVFNFLRSKEIYFIDQFKS